MKWIIKIKKGQRKKAQDDLGIRIEPRCIYLHLMPTHNIYTSQKMATRFQTRKEARSNLEFYGFEEVIKVNQ